MLVNIVNFFVRKKVYLLFTYREKHFCLQTLFVVRYFRKLGRVFNPSCRKGRGARYEHGMSVSGISQSLTNVLCVLRMFYVCEQSAYILRKCSEFTPQKPYLKKFSGASPLTPLGALTAHSLTLQLQGTLTLLACWAANTAQIKSLEQPQAG